MKKEKKEPVIEKVISIIFVQDSADNTKRLGFVMYSNALEPTGAAVDDVDLGGKGSDAIIDRFTKEGFKIDEKTVSMTDAEWQAQKTDLINQAKEAAEKMEQEQVINDSADEKISDIEEKTKTKNLKVYSKPMKAVLCAATAVVIALTAWAVGHFGTKKPADNETTTTQRDKDPNKSVDARITAMQAQFAAGELNYDITNPAEVESRINNLIGYFDKMDNNTITKAEATEFFLLLNGIEPGANVDVDELMRKVQSAAATDANFDWREVAGKEIIANKRDSAFSDVLFKVINDWKVAVDEGLKSGDMTAATAAGKEMVATLHYALIIKEPIETSVGQVSLQNISIENIAFLMGYAGMAPAIPGIDINGVIGKITIKGDESDVNKLLAEPIAGPQVLTPGENGRTDEKGGEMGLAQSTMIPIVTKHLKGEYPECPGAVQDVADNISNQEKTTAPVKSYN